MALPQQLSSASAPPSSSHSSTAPRSSGVRAAVEPPRARRTHLRSEAAYDELLPELLAVPDEQLLPVNVDVMSAITTVADALPALSELCFEAEAPASAARSLGQPALRLEQLDQLEQYTLALGHAHLLYCGSFSETLDVTLLAAELSKVRDAMLAHAEALAVAGLLDGQRLRRIALRSALHSAHRAVAGDVIALCATFKDHWPQLEDQTPYTLEEQYRLVRLALDLMAALGAQEPGPGGAGQSGVIRQRAFTLFASAYERVRATVQSLRASSGDADLVAPPLRTDCAWSCRPLTPRQLPGSAEVAPPPPASVASPVPSQPAGTPG